MNFNFDFFVAKRLINKKNGKYSKNITKIALFSMTLCIAVMLISVSILSGFKNNIRNKISLLTSDIQIINYTFEQNYSDNPIFLDNNLKDKILNNTNVSTICPVLYKTAVIMQDNQFKAVNLKGITNDFDTNFSTLALLQGSMPQINKESKQDIVISKVLIDKLQLKIGDKVKIYFWINDNYRSKNFYISGIFDTGLGDMDEQILFCDANVLQNLFGLQSQDFSMYELRLQSNSNTIEVADQIYQQLPENMTCQTTEEVLPNLFAWLNLLDSNVIMIVIIMMLVTIVTLSSVVLIMIMENKKMIGILTSFGTPYQKIINIFLYKAGWITLKAVIFGNILAILLEIIQKYTNIIKLDPQSYYLNSVPIDINPLHILIIDFFAVFICVVCMIVPTRIISKMNVVNNLKFE